MWKGVAKTFWAVALSLPLGAQPLTPQALITRERPQSCQLSPDGQWLAVQVGRVELASNRVVSEVRLYRTGESRPRQSFTDASSPSFSPDSRQLLCHRKGGLWVAGVKSGKWRQLVADEAGSAVWSPDSRLVAYFKPVGELPKGNSGRLYDDLFVRRWNHYYDGRRQHLFVTDLAGRGRDLTPGALDAGATSATYSSGDDVCFSPDGSSLFYTAPPARGQAYDTNYDVYRVDIASRKSQNLTQDNLAADLGPRLWGQRLVIVSHTRPGYESDFPTVKSCEISPDGQLQGAWRNEALGDDLGELKVAEGTLLYTRTEDMRSRAYLGQRALPHRGSLHSLSAGGGFWAGIEADFEHPARVLWGRLDGDQIHYLTPPVKWNLGAVESLEFPVEGARMQTWLIKPPSYRPDRRWPLIVLVHGGPQGGWNQDWSLRWNPQVWAAQGYLVAMPNPRGTSGRGRAFQEGVSRDWGGLAYRDLMTACDHLAARPDVDPQRMAAAGASFGGYMVNWLAVNSGRFRALVTHCGVWNLESMYGTTDELWFADWEFGGPPWGAARPPDYDRFSPHRLADRLGQFKTPHLVVHNDRDYRCPIDQGLQLFTALQRQGVPSKFLNFPDEGHWVLKPANSLRWYREVFDFVARYNPPLR